MNRRQKKKAKAEAAKLNAKVAALEEVEEPSRVRARADWSPSP
jgi:hypothetical protein